MNLTFIQYAQYVKFIFNEELERMREFLYCLEKEVDQSEDKYYIEFPMSNCPPNKEDLEKALEGRDVDADLAIINSEENKQELADAISNNNLTKREQLFDELRYLALDKAL